MRSVFQKNKLYHSIVQEIKGLINEDVILTDEEGTIVASTEEKRVGAFHEGAWLAMQKKEKMIMTKERTRSLQGVRKGVVLPIIMEGSPLGVLGITGDPSLVEPYAMVVRKVTELFIQDSTNRIYQEEHARELELFIFDWLHHSGNFEALYKRSRFFPIDMHKYVQAIVFRSVDKAIHLSFKEMEALYDKWGSKEKGLFVRLGSEKLVLLCSKMEKSELKHKVREFQEGMKERLGIDIVAGIGEVVSAEMLSESFKQAEWASRIAYKKAPIIFETELKFAMLQHELKPETKLEFIRRIIGTLSDEHVLLTTLESWFAHDMAIQKTADYMHLHRNTLHYRLKRITEITALDLDKVEDLVNLYIAVLFWKEIHAIESFENKNLFTRTNYI
ncbi:MULTISPECIES: sugar diacid recognition domain-containing protein [unclassified Virgibacillus]|uniref:CdaR family transcriptional regulator n=1 Tax=unclassified Virgibacillus TaxID=2620237 RepID=UPI0024DEB03E|nr:sugar diacid recognition domain-containing protein [Virgibacillus sp. LDC-1]